MSRRRDQSTVPDTCPLIDKIQRALERAVDFLDELEFDEATDVVTGLDSDRHRIKEELETAKYDLLEKVRTANATLRAWGNEMFYKAEEAEEAVERLESAA